MLPKPHRLPSAEVRRVLKSGKRAATLTVQLAYRTNSLSVSRFGFVVGNHIDKRATARNRIKRLLRESVRRLLPNLKIGEDIVLVIRDRLDKNLPQPRVQVILEELFYKAHLLNNVTT